MFLEVTKKDIKAELRGKTILCLMLLFSLTSAALFSLSLPNPSEFFAPLILLIFIFSGMLGYSMAFLKEFDLGTIEGLKSSPLSPQQIVIGKILFNLLLMLMVQLIATPICFGLFDVSGDFVTTFLVLTVCNSSLAITISAASPLAAHSRGRELLLPVMMFPLLFPVISTSISALNYALVGIVNLTSIAFLIAYSGIVLSVLILVADYFFY